MSVKGKKSRCVLFVKERDSKSLGMSVVYAWKDGVTPPLAAQAGEIWLFGEIDRKKKQIAQDIGTLIYSEVYIGYH